MMKDNDDINVLDIACYVINYSRVICRKKISNFILNKLLYCIQKACLKEYNKPLFKEDIVAWKSGPSIPEAWFEHCYWGGMPIQSENIVNINLFSDKDREIIENTIDKYIDVKSIQWFHLFSEKNLNTVWSRIYNGGKGYNKTLPPKLIKGEQEFVFDE